MGESKEPPLIDISFSILLPGRSLFSGDLTVQAPGVKLNLPVYANMVIRFVLWQVRKNPSKRNDLCKDNSFLFENGSPFVITLICFYCATGEITG